MARGNRKTRQKLDPKKYEVIHDAGVKKEKDWTFEDVLRSKTRRR